MSEDLGGNTSAVRREGETVRRSLGPRRAAVHRWLRHLDGTPGVPRLIGIDAGEEVLSLLPGGPPPEAPGEDAVAAAGRLLRRLHDASAGFDFGAPEDWPMADPRRAEVICHHDFAPYNLMWESGVPTGVVDFDLSGPGARVTDLAYLAWWMAPLALASDKAAETEAAITAGLPRLRLLCAAYGAPTDAGLVSEIHAVLTRMADPARAAAALGPQPAARLMKGGHFAYWHREAAAFAAAMPRIEAALGLG
ncbi:phosphotransferase [Pseudoroseicyclus sp. CXY001]|uniref:phosphotransferase n=1 Tax=Pseudoroseicyclus sp. CXY001 TaxID=3242492 RepID=UPI00357120BD